MLTKYYSGFYIDKPVGNNAFSYDQRSHQRIYVPPLIEGTLDDLVLGNEIVFSEVRDNKEYNLKGLANFVKFYHKQTPVYIFDNHNHALSFWAHAQSEGVIQIPIPLVHVDQHKDMREPERWFNKELWGDLKAVFEYVNRDLNVGNFIKPAIKGEMISDVLMVDNEEAFSAQLPSRFILDIDIDVFSDEMAYIDDNFKLKKIREWITQAAVITIATSPYFIDQDKAVSFVRKLFQE